MEGKKKRETKYANYDDTKSQHSSYSFDRRSVGTARTYESTAGLTRQLDYLKQKIGQEAHEEIASLYYGVGLKHYEDKEYTDAINNLSLALAMYSELQTRALIEEGETHVSKGNKIPKHEIEIADIHKMLGMVYLARGKEKELDKARRNFKKALIRKQTIYGLNVSHLAITEELDIVEIVSALSNTSVDFSQIDSAEHLDIAEIVRSLGHTYLVPGSTAPETAVFLLTTALEHFQNIYGEDTDHSEIADTYYDLGRAYQSLNDHVKAREQWTAARVMLQQLSTQSNQAKIADIHYKIAFTHLSGNRYDKAIQSFNKSLEIYTSMDAAESQISLQHIDVLFHLGKTHLATREYDLAKTFIGKAWLKYQGLFGDSNPAHPALQAARLALTEVEEKIAEQNNVATEIEVNHQNPIQQVPADTKQPSDFSLASDKLPNSEPLKLESTSKHSRISNSAAQKPSSVSVSQQGIFAPPPIATASTSTGPALKHKETTEKGKLRELREVYMKNAKGWSSLSVFKPTLNETLTALKNRAGNGGASLKTLQHFGYIT